MGEVIDFPTSSPSETGHIWLMYKCVECGIARNEETETQPCAINETDDWFQEEIDRRNKSGGDPIYMPSPETYSSPPPLPSLPSQYVYVEARPGFLYVLGQCILGMSAAVLIFIVILVILALAIA